MVHVIGAIEAGQFISFSYNPPKPPPKRQYVRKAVQQRMPDGTVRSVPGPLQQVKPQPEPPKDPHKEVLVLHPNWQGRMHAIDLKRLTPAEAQTLRAIMDPKVKAAVDAGQWPVDGAPPYPLVRDILHRMDPVELIKNPIGFYQRLVKPFIRNKDVYRQYFPQYISGLQVIKESNVKGQVTNPKPLFHK